MSRLEVIVEDVAFGESVRWHDGRVWFCDWLDGDVCSVAPDGSDRTVHAHADGYPLSIDWTPVGELMVVDGAARQLAPTTGQIAAVALDGTVTLAADGLAFPNGMAINADATMLVVAESHAGQITAFTIGDDGTLTERRVFAAIEESAPDGIAFATDGSPWYADVPNRHCQRVADGGAIIDNVAVDRGCLSCATDSDGALYIAGTVWESDTFNTRRRLIYKATTSGDRTDDS